MQERVHEQGGQINCPPRSYSLERTEHNASNTNSIMWSVLGEEKYQLGCFRLQVRDPTKKWLKQEIWRQGVAKFNSAIQ